MPAGQPVAVSSGGRTHVFAIADGGAMNQWTSTDDGAWTGPRALPGGNHLARSFPCAIALADGSVHVFGISATGLLVRWSSTDGGNSWAPVPQFDGRFVIPGGGNGLAVASMGGSRMDVFALTTSGIIQYSLSGGSSAPAPLPNSTGLRRCVLAAVSSGPATLDVFAVEPNVGMPLHWRFANGAWAKQHVAGPPLNIDRSNGFAAVSPAPGRVELFAITRDARMTNWSLTGSVYVSRQLQAGRWALPDGVPAAVAGPAGRIDVFAIGAGSALGGGPLVHWRFDGAWGEPVAYDASLAAGGVGAARGASGLDAFGFNAGANNSLQHWPGGIQGNPTTPWANWAGNRQTHVEGHCYPTCREELVEIVRSAALAGKRVRAVGSSWSMSDIAMTPGFVVETSRLDRILTDTIPAAMVAPYATSPAPHHLVHAEAGIQLETLMAHLDRTGRAPHTMGGAAGQTLAGVISTSVHGSHFLLPPFPDWVRAVHLVGPDGKQRWIEPRDRPITDPAKLRAVLGPEVSIHYDDDWFDSVLVAVGSLGILYSVVLEVTDQYVLEETCETIPWTFPALPAGVPAPPTLRAKLLDGSVFTDPAPAGLGDLRHRVGVQVAVDIGSLSSASPVCFLTTRVNAPLQLTATDPSGVTQVMDTWPMGGSSVDPLAMLCEGDRVFEALFHAGAATIGLAIGPAILAAVVAVNPAAAALLPVVLSPLVIPLLLEQLRKPGAVGDVLAIVLDKHPQLTALVVSEVTKGQLSTGRPARRNIAHNLMAPRNRGECAARALALELAFDTTDGSYVQFIDAALAMLRDEAAMGHVLGGWLSFRFVGRSRAILSPQRSAMTCMIEAVGLRKLGSTPVLLARLESLGRSFGAVQHWGMFDDLTYEDVARGYPRLDTWLRVRAQLTGNGATRTFDNAFTERCGLDADAKPRKLLVNRADGAVYAIYGGARFHVPNPDTLNRLFPGVPLRQAQDGELDRVGRIPGDGTLLHEETTGAVYAIYGGARFHVPSWETLTRLFPGFLLRPLWGGALDHIPDRPADGTLLREENGTIWVVFGGARFRVPNPPSPQRSVYTELPFWSPMAPAVVNEMFGKRLSRRGPLHQLWDGALDHVPAIPADGTLFREASTDAVYVIRGGRKELSPDAPLQRGVLPPARTVHVLWDGALAQIPSAWTPIGTIELTPISPVIEAPVRRRR
jgi:hypothetical protein